MLPIGAWRAYGSDDYVVDRFDVSYAPSLTISEVCRRRRTQPTRDTHLVSVSSPVADLDLPEAGLVARELHPAKHTPLTGAQADRDHWSALSPDATHTHYSGHGTYVWDDPLSSHIGLADGQLTLGDLFDGTIPLNRSQFTALSACETTMTDPRDLADEYLGISSGFIFGGSPTVFSTLWVVSAEAAMLLSHRFYHELARRHQPSQALAISQRWLRCAEHRDVAAVLKHTPATGGDRAQRSAITTVLDRLMARKRLPKARPFSHSVYWAPFIVVGAEDVQSM
jgi:CHAT domain-containing protein